MNSKVKNLLIGLSLLTCGLIIVAVFALLNSSSAVFRASRAFGLILLISFAVITALLMAVSGMFVKFRFDVAEPEEPDAVCSEAKRNIKVSDALLRLLQKGYSNGKNMPALHKSAIENLVQYGDCLPAIVVSTTPLLISVFSEELDCAEVYSFPASMLEKFMIVEGSHLVAAVSYPQRGSAKSGSDSNRFNAVILDFVSEDVTRLSRLSVAIPMIKWSQAFIYGESLVRDHPERIRSGDPSLVK